MCICVYYVIGVFCCAEKEEGEMEVVIDWSQKGRRRTKSVFYLCFPLISDKRSKEGQLSYPNFVRGLFFYGMQPLVDRFEVLSTLCCTIREVPRHVRSQKEALLCNPWNSVTCRKSKGSVVAQSVSFRNILKAKKGVITWPIRFRNLTEIKQVSLQNS